MNVFKYVVNSRYRNKFNEEYSSEFAGRFDQQDQQYDRIYQDMGIKDKETYPQK